jgi:hypothetical protein
MATVRRSARVGSFLELRTAIGFMNGMMPSLAMDWSRRGAPVRDCRPAPKVERREPISITWRSQ